MLNIIRSTLRAPVSNIVRTFQTSVPLATEKFDHKRIPQSDEGVQGEKLVDLDSVLKAKQNIFPTLDSDNLLFDGTPFKELPIINIRISNNNTIITLTDCGGTVKAIRSCGMEGFKNTKKGTNIAAQTTAIALATSSVKGLQMGGLDIVSITDNTHVSWNPPRPRKARRL
ncbi:putative mitochondrial ribosomal protein [Operophtera brumata]|uniref:Putative mitochondrial ribosomal protein n=1 Tax=Operophtera brumata TaxID=104452 RepID=A0A0L7L2A0_OPEBR|nr:putative mitochondrial ribosomal protein [Operophtera brumata]